MESLQAVQGAGGTVISVICDNRRTNLSVFFKLGGPGQVFITSLNVSVFLTFDYVHTIG